MRLRTRIFFANLPATSNGNHLLETNVNEEQLMELAPDVINLEPQR